MLHSCQFNRYSIERERERGRNRASYIKILFRGQRDSCFKWFRDAGHRGGEILRRLNGSGFGSGESGSLVKDGSSLEVLPIPYPGDENFI